MRTYRDTPDPKDRWGTVTSTLDDAEDLQGVERRLNRLGFPDYEDLVSRVGKVRLYAYQGQKPFSYHYCCIISIGKFGMPILLKDLPDVFRLMAEIGAHPPQDNSLAQSLEEIKNELWEATTLLKKLPTAQHLEEVKQPLQEITTTLKSLKTTLLTKIVGILPSENRSPH